MEIRLLFQKMNQLFMLVMLCVFLSSCSQSEKNVSSSSLQKSSKEASSLKPEKDDPLFVYDSSQETINSIHKAYSSLATFDETPPTQELPLSNEQNEEVPNTAKMDITKPDTPNDNLSSTNNEQNLPHKSLEALEKKVLPSKSIPILYYHAVSDDVWGMDALFVSPKTFDMQMQYLKTAGYTPITFDELPQSSKYTNPILITFDDGYENNYTEAYPILKKYQFKAVVFLTTQFIDKPRYLKTTQVQAMRDLVHFEAHTLRHPDLTSLGASALKDELQTPKEILKNLTGRTPIAVAYPFGYFNQTVIDAVKPHYTYGVTTESGLFEHNENPYRIERVYVPRNTSLEQFKTRLAKGSL